ncbi:MAG: hypothetical protein V1863_06690 [Candidatus Omnitrophota bacterium]
MRKKSHGFDRADSRALTKRYLLWLYKTTRDELDKIDRKFTQLDVDLQIQTMLAKRAATMPKDLRGSLGPFLKEWQEYVFEKDSDAQKLKIGEDGRPNARYVFLRLKIEVISRLIRGHFGQQGLKEIKKRYEESCVQRILEDVSGRR